MQFASNFLFWINVLWKVKMKSLSCVRLCATTWTVAYQAPLPMERARGQEGTPGKNTGVGCHFLLQGMYFEDLH